ncbi:MAG: hypothetical protein QOI97_5440 [Pseudomonas sp.]|jgi:hypothetical protein|nr:hypothetical protein [Pseudomonas sp.]
MSGRDTSARLPVIDGPCKGQRIAQVQDSFSFEIASTSSKTKGKFTYHLRRHRLIGLVWASPTNKSVSPIES